MVLFKVLLPFLAAPFLWQAAFGDEWRVTSSFGRRIDPISGKPSFHPGIDLVMPEGSVVRSPLDGVVAYSGRFFGYGNLVTIYNGSGITTHFAHLKTAEVQVGERVYKGDPIGIVGRSGRATGVHLHFEVRIRGKVVDPVALLRKSSGSRGTNTSLLLLLSDPP